MTNEQKQKMISVVNQAVRTLSDQDTEYGLHHLNLDDVDSVKVKNAFTEVVNNGIWLLSLLKDIKVE